MVTAESRREFSRALEGLFLELHHRRREQLRRVGLTLVQFAVLKWALSETEATLGRVAKYLGVRPQTVTPLGDSLEREGLIQRVATANDRRASRLVLTAKGARMLKSLDERILLDLEAPLDSVPEAAIRTAAGTFRTIAAGLSARRQPALGAKSARRPGRALLGPAARGSGRVRRGKVPA